MTAADVLTLGLLALFVLVVAVGVWEIVARRKENDR
jgi:hypothetical protein